MRIIPNISITCAFLINLFSFSVSEEIRFAFELFRHGARSPYNEMTADYVDWFGEKWSGVKEWTGVGMRQHYLWGYRNRVRYIGLEDDKNLLLSKAYDPREVFIISTDTNRTILSANAQLQGLYPPGTGEKLTTKQIDNAVPPNEASTYNDEKTKLGNNALPNQMNILPVHSFFTKDRKIQWQDHKVCPGVIPLYEENKKNQTIINFLDLLNKEFGEKISKMIKIDDQFLFKNYTRTYSVLDAVIAGNSDGRDQNKFTSLGIDYNALYSRSLEFFELDFVGNGQNDEKIGLFSMSPTLSQVWSYMQNKIDKDINKQYDYKGYDTPKFVMYSVHDSTVGAFEAFMKAVFNVKVLYAYFASNANWELFIKEKKETWTEDDYYVRYLFDDVAVISEMKWTEFRDTVKKSLKTTAEIAEFCQFVPDPKPSTNYYWISTIVLGVVAIALIVLIVFTFMKNRKDTTSGVLLPENEDLLKA